MSVSQSNCGTNEPIMKATVVNEGGSVLWPDLYPPYVDVRHT